MRFDARHRHRPADPDRTSPEQHDPRGARSGGVSSYSVYPLYSPFRLVIDCLRTSAAVAATAPPPSGAPLARARHGRQSCTRHCASCSACSACADDAHSAGSSAAAGRRIICGAGPACTAGRDCRPHRLRALCRDGSTSRAGAGRQRRALGACRQADCPSGNERATSVRPGTASLGRNAGQTAGSSVLQARRVRWVLAMPAGAATRLPDTRIVPVAAPPVVTAGCRRRCPPATATPPPVPSPNVSGGLSIARQLGLGVSRIVIDPGHGGHDPGAQGDGHDRGGTGARRRVASGEAARQVPGVEVVLTRRDDQFVALQERTAIANREGADLFLSIHANASAYRPRAASRPTS